MSDQITQIKYDKLSALYGVQSIKNLERLYVRDLLDTPPSEGVRALDDLWSLYYDQEGVAEGNSQDRAQVFLIDDLSQPGSTVYPEWDEDAADDTKFSFSGGYGAQIADRIGSDAGQTAVLSKRYHSSGKWYGELFIWSLPYIERIGIVRRDGPTSIINGWMMPGTHDYSWGWDHYNKTVMNNNANIVTGMPGPWQSNWRIRIALDLDNNKLWFGTGSGWCSNTGAYTGNPATGANPTVSGLGADGTKVFRLAAGAYYTSSNCYFYSNTDKTAFLYSVPSGYTAFSDNYTIPPVSPENTELPNLWWEYWNKI